MGKDYQTTATISDFKFGGDAKMTIANSLNLDLTVNPDFSQVEVDQQVTNLTRFEVGLPERRCFFIENSDLVTLVIVEMPIRFFQGESELLRTWTAII